MTTQACTTYYFIEGEEIALLQANPDNNATLPSSANFAEDINKLLQEEAVPFKVFDDSYKSNPNNLSQSPNPQTNTHAVINYKNLTSTVKQRLGLSLVMIRNMIPLWTRTQTYIAFKAMQVLRWQQDHTFCSRCGNRTSTHRNELAKVCNTCQYRQYPRLHPCIIVAITREINDHGKKQKQILLAKDRRFKRDMYSVIAGFVEVGETLEQAVMRETLEETNLHIKNIRYLGSQPWPFPSNLMIAFHAEYSGNELSIDKDELVHAEFFNVDSLPSIPPKGSISYEMIQHISTGKPIEL